MALALRGSNSEMWIPGTEVGMAPKLHVSHVGPPALGRRYERRDMQQYPSPPRVLENLVSNGIRHTPAGSGFALSSRRSRPRARRGSRPGAWCATRSQREIFDKFGALQARHDRSYHSVGLGLAFCKLAIGAQGGTIGVDSGVPAGSTFWFELPA